MEQWKEFNRKKNGLAFEVSDLGNVRLLQYFEDKVIDSELLSIGHGLYYIKDKSGQYYNVRCYNVVDNIYRIVYRTFVGPINKCYQIHHINFDHTDNRLSNIVCLSPHEHGKYHIWQGYLESENTLNIHLNDYDEINQKYIYELVKDYITAVDNYNNISTINYTGEDAANDYRLITSRFKNKIKEIKQNRVNQRKQQREQQQLLEQAERQRKIDNGEYAIGSNGRLYLAKRKQWTPERRAKTMTTRKTSDAWKNRPNKLSATLKDKWENDPEFRNYMIELYHKNNLGDKVSKTLKDKWSNDPEFRCYMINCFRKNK